MNTARPGRRYAVGTNARHVSKPLQNKAASMPAYDHAAIVGGRTMYPTTIISADDAVNLLVPGINHWKIGKEISKGKWNGFPIFTLTLEERATCPASCRHWRSCFGNHMHLARRIKHDAVFESRLAFEVANLQCRYPHGFAVRLHVLGDFYAVRYVELWRRLLQTFPALHVFGFSARWERTDPIAVELVKLVMDEWDRFAIRFSNAPVDECSTISIEHPGAAPADAIVCPQQVGRTDSCSTCALCWQSKQRIAFLQH